MQDKKFVDFNVLKTIDIKDIDGMTTVTHEGVNYHFQIYGFNHRCMLPFFTFREHDACGAYLDIHKQYAETRNRRFVRVMPLVDKNDQLITYAPIMSLSSMVEFVHMAHIAHGRRRNPEITKIYMSIIDAVIADNGLKLDQKSALVKGIYNQENYGPKFISCVDEYEVLKYVGVSLNPYNKRDAKRIKSIIRRTEPKLEHLRELAEIIG